MAHAVINVSDSLMNPSFKKASINGSRNFFLAETQNIHKMFMYRFQFLVKFGIVPKFDNYAN